MIVRLLVIAALALYVAHRWVPRVHVTWPFVILVVVVTLGVRLAFEYA